MIDQGGCKRAVLTVAIRCCRSRLRRERDHCVRAGRFDLGKPATDGACRDCSLHLFCKGIVATSIKDNETKLLGWLYGEQYAVKRQRFVQNVGIGFKCCVYRDEV